MKKFKKEKDLMEILMKGEYNKSRFRRAVEIAYMSEDVTKYIKEKNVCFEQGSGRVASIPIDIVEDIIGVELQLSRRVA